MQPGSLVHYLCRVLAGSIFNYLCRVHPGSLLIYQSTARYPGSLPVLSISRYPLDLPEYSQAAWFITCVEHSQVGQSQHSQVEHGGDLPQLLPGQHEDGEDVAHSAHGQQDRGAHPPHFLRQEELREGADGCIAMVTHGGKGLLEARGDLCEEAHVGGRPRSMERS